MPSKDKVLVAMSGGVDSSVALLEIIEAGYEAIGITMKLWEYRDVGGNLLDDSNCCSIGAINNAKLVCDRMGVAHYTLDFTGVFRETVVDNFAEEYLAGRTPNPCVRCNSFVKWDAFIEQADQLGAQYIATGHYARIIQSDNNFRLAKGKDPLKDQAYVLWGIPAETLQRTLLPLGDYTKEDVRNIARKHKLETAETPESMEICFVADNNYKRFLKDYAPNEIEAIGQGKIVEGNGEVVGVHSGYTNYTIGQRKGLGLSNSEPRYVSKIDPDSNRIFIGKKESLYEQSCRVTQINWLEQNLHFPIKVNAQIRYNSQPVPAVVKQNGEKLLVQFVAPQLSITPGQSIVFYRDDIVIGGGIIELN